MRGGPGGSGACEAPPGWGSRYERCGVLTMSYSMEAYEALYQEPAGEEAIEGLRHKDVNNYRMKAYHAGEQMDVICFPILKHLADIQRAKAAKAKSTEAQQKVNERNSLRKFKRKANANFGKGDLGMTLTFFDWEQPATIEEAQRHVQNYIERIKYERDKRCLSKLKYMYTIAMTVCKDGIIKYHAHIIMSGNGMSRDEVEKKWPFGNANSKRYQWNPNGFAGFAHYMLMDKKERKGRRPQFTATTRRYACSKNLVDPKPVKSDKKLSRLQMKMIALAGEYQAADLFEKLYPGYELVNCEVSCSKYAPGAYLYAQMRRKVTEGEGKRLQTNRKRGGGARSVI